MNSFNDPNKVAGKKWEPVSNRKLCEWHARHGDEQPPFCSAVRWRIFLRWRE